MFLSILICNLRRFPYPPIPLSLTNKEDQEGPIVPVAYAVVGPWTMMIHPQNAVLAHTAVVTAGWLECLACAILK